MMKKEYVSPEYEIEKYTTICQVTTSGLDAVATDEGIYDDFDF
jgi:hypothetical protein